MDSLRKIGLCAVGFSCLTGSAWALSPGDKVDNFRLIDQRGESHQLYYLSDMKAVVLMAQGNGCAASRTAAATLEGLRAKYPNVEFLAINSNLDNQRETILKEADGNGIKLPVLIDATQLIGEGLGLTRNGEVLVVDTKEWKVAYRGGADNAANALAAVTSGAAVKTAETQVAGCAIRMPERDKRAAHEKISYTKAIAPMLEKNCVACHRAGGIGPWQMSSYEMVKGFSPMIREVLRTERMPPWHADPHYGVFSNDRSLTNEQTRTLVHWIEAGAPRGTGPDPLLAQKKDWPEWPLGQPDLVVDLPKFDVPATGVIPYQMWTVANPLDHDVWIRAVDFLPGERSVLHHIIASVGGEIVPDAAPLPTAAGGEGGRPARRSREPGDGSLADYVPGAQPLQIPAEAGILLSKGAKFSFQAHYTPNGKAATDHTRMGLYFMKAPPQYRYRAAIFANPQIKIPANTKAHAENATRTFDKEVLVYSLHPHSHFRGRSASFVAQYPDGSRETLLNVPAYDFNWQTTYELTKPRVLPAGTKIVYTTVFDNSTQNKANPDPNRVVPWGQQTWDEMLYGVIRYRYIDEKPTQQTANAAP